MLFAPVVVALVVFLYVFCVHSTVKSATVFNVVRGDSVTGVANRLAKNNLIDSKDAFVALIRFNGGTIQSGQYDIPQSASLWRIARMMTTGDVATTTVVIPEGLTVMQIKNILLQHSGLQGAVECDDNKSRPVCNLKDGQIFPDTYRVARGTNRLAVLELMRKKMIDVNNHIKAAYRVLPRPLKTWDDVVTLASIVQKETPIAREMPIVAGVYLNRLNKGMRLQADPTVVYALTNGLGDMQGKPILSSHLKIDSPYNTYRNSGLPPTPIANVGQNAIRAVMRPAETNFLFFVADGQGGHRFSIDYAQHQKNHDAWRKIKKSRNK
ncbi:MAG: endolytic transglycosylase MltG [Alphaproteobacteria bacterium]|nr:endolytic transglycosylase MltG [Alphaproteobacteria bacterium]